MFTYYNILSSLPASSALTLTAPLDGSFQLLAFYTWEEWDF